MAIIITCPCGAGFRGRGRGMDSYNQALRDASLQLIEHLGEHSLDMSFIDLDSTEGLQRAVENISSIMPDVQFSVR